MSVADVTSRIQSIQSQLAMLGAQSTSTSGSSFSSVLDGATSAARTSATTGTTGSTGGSALSGDAIVTDAKKYLGIPYVWGGTDPQKGLDCSGLVQRVYKDFGIDLPRVSRDQAQVGTPVASLDEAQPGDLLAFGSPVHHIAIYAGDGKMVEAPRTGLDVRVTDVYETPTAIRRVIGSDLDTSAATASAASIASSAASSGSSVLGGALSLSDLPGVSSSNVASADSLASVAAAAASSTSSTGTTPYAGLFNDAASTYGISAKLLAAVAKQESGYDAAAVSPAGAQGLMQLMPSTAKGLGVSNSFDPAQAIDGAAKLLSQLQSKFGSTPLALAAYNAGPGAVLRYNGIPPYPETQNYVKSIMAMVGQN
jgi:peptidoglycan DL-endopeptidase CwlO